MNKRGINLLGGTLVFLLLNLAFFSIMFIAVSRAGVSAPYLEKSYGSQIALLIDSSKKGTTLSIDIVELLQTAQKEKINPVIKLDCGTNEVIIKITNSDGYRHAFFTELEECSYSLDQQKGRLVIKI